MQAPVLLLVLYIRDTFVMLIIVFGELSDAARKV